MIIKGSVCDAGRWETTKIYVDWLQGDLRPQSAKIKINGLLFECYDQHAAAGNLFFASVEADSLRFFFSGRDLARVKSRYMAIQRVAHSLIESFEAIRTGRRNGFVTQDREGRQWFNQTLKLFINPWARAHGRVADHEKLVASIELCLREGDFTFDELKAFEKFLDSAKALKR